MLVENRAEGAGCAQLCGCTTLTTELWLLGQGLDDDFASRSRRQLRPRLLYGDPSVHPTRQFGILRAQLYDRETRNVQFVWDSGHAEQAQGILLQL